MLNVCFTIWWILKILPGTILNSDKSGDQNLHITYRCKIYWGLYKDKWMGMYVKAYGTFVRQVQGATAFIFAPTWEIYSRPRVMNAEASVRPFGRRGVSIPLLAQTKTCRKICDIY